MPFRLAQLCNRRWCTPDRCRSRSLWGSLSIQLFVRMFSPHIQREAKNRDAFMQNLRVAHCRKFYFKTLFFCGGITLRGPMRIGQWERKRKRSAFGHPSLLGPSPAVTSTIFCSMSYPCLYGRLLDVICGLKCRMNSAHDLACLRAIADGHGRNTLEKQVGKQCRIAPIAQ